MIALLLLQAAASPAPPIPDARLFEDPVRLLSAGELLNEVEQMPYPSPVVFDVDRDGERELVVGDLWGRIWIYEDQASPGDLAWGPARKLEVDGEELRVPNW